MPQRRSRSLWLKAKKVDYVVAHHDHRSSKNRKKKLPEHFWMKDYKRRSLEKQEKRIKQSLVQKKYVIPHKTTVRESFEED